MKTKGPIPSKKPNNPITALLEAAEKYCHEAYYPPDSLLL